MFNVYAMSRTENNSHARKCVLRKIVVAQKEFLRKFERKSWNRSTQENCNNIRELCACVRVSCMAWPMSMLFFGAAKLKRTIFFCFFFFANVIMWNFTATSCALFPMRCHSIVSHTHRFLLRNMQNFVQ